MNEQENLAAVTKVCLGNADAIRFLTDVTEVLHLWDDLIDRDHVLTDTTINRGMWKALVELPRNSFYLHNFSALNAVLVSAIVNWEVATQMERHPQGPNDKSIAFIIRSSYVDLITLVAAICGGREHAVSMMLEARRLWHDEGLHGYLANLRKEQVAREGNSNGM